MSSTMSAVGVTKGTLRTIKQILKTLFLNYFKILFLSDPFFEIASSSLTTATSLASIQKTPNKLEQAHKASRNFKNALTVIICADPELHPSCPFRHCDRT